MSASCVHSARARQKKPKQNSSLARLGFPLSAVAMTTTSPGRPRSRLAPALPLLLRPGFFSSPLPNPESSTAPPRGMMYVTSYALPTELPPPPLMPPPPPWAPMATASHLPGRGWQGGGGGSTSDRGGSGSSSRGMRATAGEQLEPRAGDSGSRIYEEHEERGQPPWKKFVYVEPPRRVKEVLEEELYFRRDECRIKHPSEG
ncbi:uncharacterized protein C11orf97 homolog isoform X2 [Hemicordylus capensis]|uniref:uncharacterized protein C11orf97 homolog isoform X2 n=1 Tax=Hemicordylus capensis TaxID=884348 RepID=UPI002303CD00|nr:uncharacterized protein C11orf97 homolog isoform X2 [Hemicordylus capensis]